MAENTKYSSENKENEFEESNKILENTECSLVDNPTSSQSSEVVESPAISSQENNSDPSISTRKAESSIGEDHETSQESGRFKKRKTIKRNVRERRSSDSSNSSSNVEEAPTIASANENVGNDRAENVDERARTSPGIDESNSSFSDDIPNYSPLPSLEQDIFDPDEDESHVCFIADTFSKPKYKWHASKEVIGRQYGIPSRLSSDLFRLRCNGSLHVVERLELMYKMESHEGCVNSLNFNSTGTRLASGSDDLNIGIWDWALGESLLMFDSGHSANVFQSKFLPMSGDCHIVTCARDGHVRLAELSSDGTFKGSRKVAHHRGSAHKLCIEPMSPSTVISCGEDAVVFGIDLRESKPQKLLTCRNNTDRKVPLYAIHSHPMKSHEFIVGGHDHFVRVYDKRFIGDNSLVLKKICPNHLRESNIKAYVTCCVYNHDGTEILASYNDEDIYLFDWPMVTNTSYKHRYQGHRNCKTVKGVNFFGPESQYVVSGSDCGSIYYWEKCSSKIVQCMPGDDGGVVNCLEPHPNLPVIATSGLDDDIKIWIPSHEEPPDLSRYKNVVRQNKRDRVLDRKDGDRSNVDSQMFWYILNRIQWHNRERENRESSADGEPNEEEPTIDSDSDEDVNPARCTQS